MRLHLTIQRHGLPVTRILWTTSPPSLFGHHLPTPSSILPAASSAITSSRAPNALYSNGGYTIAQLLEDVNEVVPLETEPRLLEDESSGQWGLEDYVVEVGGSECLHFMEVEGLLRDGDEILIRALQISDLRARRISGRHQISADGKHLIDGVPFGKPFLKRPTSTRPAIMIPPRKKRRTALALWGNRKTYEEEDTEWAPAHIGTGKELSLLKPDSDSGDEYEDAYHDDYEDYHEPSEGGDDTVIRHPVDRPDQPSEVDQDISEFEAEDLTQELNDLKKDMEVSELEERHEKENGNRGYSLRSGPGVLPPPPRKSSLSRPGDKQSSGGGNTRRDSKAVRFDSEKKAPSIAKPEKVIIRAGSTSDEFENSVSSESDISSSASESSDSKSNSGSESSSSHDSTSDSESDSSSDSENSVSAVGDELMSNAAMQPLSTNSNPPGHGSLRTKRSNQRFKLRRKLSKLKELGFLDKEADFTALRQWEEEHGSSFYTPATDSDAKDKEQEEFEAKRQQLLRELESGGIDVSIISEKENVPPNHIEQDAEMRPTGEDDRQYKAVDDVDEADLDISRRPTLDVASTRRMLFGSLGVRTPRSKDEEETTRQKLAAKAQKFVPRQVVQEGHDKKPEPEPETDVEWRDKLILGATECAYDDIQLIAPTFPFEQRWDVEAGNIMRERKGWGKKRKRRQQLQVYDGETGETWDDSFFDEGMQLNYDDVELQNTREELVEETENGAIQDTSNNLPSLPSDPSTLPDLVAADMKRGLVFAFKQLDVSKATNWQPTVSDYRVAEISDVFDDNIFGIRLATPYRRQTRAAEDGEDGPFHYSGFEMPGLDDKEEDDGFREVPFDDLIDPKLIRTAPVETIVEDTNDDGNSSAVEAPSVQNPNPRAIEIETTNDRQRNGHEAIGEELPGSGSPANDISPVQSPRFDGFEPTPAGSAPASKANPVAKANADEEDKHDGTRNRDSPCEKDDPSTLNSTCPPNTYPPNLPETGLSDQLQTISSPGSISSFQNLMNDLLNHNPPSSPKRSSPASHSSSPSIVPNPFYEIDRAHEERRQRVNSYDSAISRASSPAVEAPSSPLSQKNPKSVDQESPPSQDPSQPGMVPDSIPQVEKDEGPDSQIPSPWPGSGEVVDLTQSSPPVSPGGSDEDFAKTHRLPRGPGWVQKNIPTTRRQTRRSTTRTTRLPATPQASRIPRRKKRRSRRA